MYLKVLFHLLLVRMKKVTKNLRQDGRPPVRATDGTADSSTAPEI
jgi:hypothetical protein